jgi:hypothetical protein
LVWINVLFVFQSYDLADLVAGKHLVGNISHLLATHFSQTVQTVEM